MPRRRNGDEGLRSLERRVLAGDLTLVPELARVYERTGRQSGQRKTTVVAIVSESGMPRHFVFSHDIGISADGVGERMRAAIVARFSQPRHQEWLRTHGNLNWVMGATAVPDEDWSAYGLDLISKGTAGLSLDADEIVVTAPLEPGEFVQGRVLVGAGTLEDVAEFNAVAWLRQADRETLERLVHDEWIGVLGRDDVGDAAGMAAEEDPVFAARLAEVERDTRGEIHISIDDEAGGRWILDNHPRLARRLLGRDDRY